MKTPTEELLDKLNEFISKYYKNQMIKGGIYFFAVLLLFFIVFSVLEYYSQFNITIRTILFWSYLLLNLYIFSRYVLIPLLHLFRIGKIILPEQAAILIGKHFPEIDDKLLNILQLNQMGVQENAIVRASIEQKIATIAVFSFSSAIHFSENKKYLKWIILPIVVLILIFGSGNQQIITESSARILRHNTYFEPKAPFQFVVEQKTLRVIKQEDFELTVSIKGNAIPQEIFVEIEGNKFRLRTLAKDRFAHTFNNVVEATNFRLYASGYYSQNYVLNVLPKPAIVNFQIEVKPPQYTGLKQQQLNNMGDITIAEGSLVQWSFDVKNTDRLFVQMDGKKQMSDRANEAKMLFQQKLKRSTTYQVITENAFIKDSISYHIQIIPDAYPTIEVEQQIDSISSNIVFNGFAKDDYKVRQLEFCYQITQNDSDIQQREVIRIQQEPQQAFFYVLDLNTLHLKLGSRLSYYFQVWDNDGVNGSKSTKSRIFSHQVPDKASFENKLEQQEKAIKSDLQESMELAKEIKKDISTLNKEILEKKSLGWEEKKKIENLIAKQKNLEQQLQEVKQKHSAKQNQQEKYQQHSKELLEKQQQLEKLFDQVLDEETKKLLKEMEQMMQDIDKQKTKELLDKLNRQETDLEKQLDRNLELFKQLEFEQKLETVLDKLNQLEEKQKQLKEQTSAKESDNDALSKKQEELEKEFLQIQQEIEELREKNQALEEQNKLPDTRQSEKDIASEMKQSKEDLQKNNKKNSSQSQQKAMEKLQEIQQQLQSLQESSSSSVHQEDLETLRQILENLIRLSFDQEELMNGVQTTPLNSPKYVELVKNQKKLVDDAKIVEDSLFALSKRVVEIEHTINREISAIKENMALATDHLEQRIIQKASAYQQFSMTAANNLALILSEMLHQMQQNLANQQKCNKPSNKQCNKPGNGKPSLSKIKEMQKKLNKQMKEMMGKKGEKQNEYGSKALVKLSQQQESIRKQLQELREEMESGEKGNIDKMLKQMEQNEKDIVNNQITQETIRRQEEILTRLLEAENAQREKEEEPKRESTEWKYELINNKDAFSGYTKQKEKQLELLLTKPAHLSSFYKGKVEEYFNNLSKEKP